MRERSLGGKRTFTFDCVLNPETSNKECYDKVAKQLVLKAMRGYNATVFAYGQTGSGKTWSMLGDGRGLDGQNKGIIPRALLEVFDYVKASQDRDFLLRVSYLEVYNYHLTYSYGYIPHAPTPLSNPSARAGRAPGGPRLQPHSA